MLLNQVLISSFIKVLAEQVFKETNVISDDMKEKDAVGQMTGKLEAVS